VALLLRNKGVKRIRPLQGGLDAWRELGYPLQALAVGEETEPISKFLGE
jgi:3-mercaptopyruvate sulfurtransferase SseA